MREIIGLGVILAFVCGHTSYRVFGQGVGTETHDIYRRNWKALDDLDHTQRSYKVRRTNLLEPNKPPIQYAVKVRQDRWLFTASHSGIQSIFAHSPQYQFLLWKEPAASGWTLRQFSQDSISPDAVKFERSTGELQICRPLGVLFLLTRKDEPKDPSLFELSQRQNFKIVRITQHSGEQDKIEFEYLDTSGIIIADRMHSSLVVQSIIRGGGRTPGSKPWIMEMKRREVFPDVGLNNTIRCQRIEFIGSDGNSGRIVQHESLEFSDYSDDPISDHDFQLSNYGLPEPVGMTNRSSIPNYIWLLIGAGTFAVFGFLFHIISRRNPAKQ